MYTTHDIIMMIYKDYFASIFRASGGEQLLINCPDMPEECAEDIRQQIALNDFRAEMAMVACALIGGV